MQSVIDLRSDTVTRPTPEMRKVIAEAEVGDDVFGDDPTVNRLQDYAAELLGKEAALFCASGTQTNFVGLLSHCGRGDEYIVGQQAHTYRYEGGGAAVFGGIQPQPLEFDEDGTLPLDRVKAAIKPIDNHYARTRLLCLENTHGGKVLPLAYLEQARAFTREHGLALHLDGARMFNAAVKLGVPALSISQHFDSVSCCLSKGLGAPVGSLLCGSRDLIEEAKRWRKVAGGGMRQAGILAAAGLYALEHHVERLAEDHEKAEALISGLAHIDELRFLPGTGQTNIIFFETAASEPLVTFLKERGILISGYGLLRMVTHLDISPNDIKRTIAAFEDYFQSH